MRERRFWGVALLLVGLGAIVAPRVVPLFDGVGFPDQPYRYVAPPAGTVATPPPSAASGQAPVVRGITTAGLSLATMEQGPQASLYVPLAGVGGADGTVTVSLTPEAPVGQPAGAILDGNVYRVALVDSAGGPVSLVKTPAPGLVLMRATSARQPSPLFEYREHPGDPWRELTVIRSGQDIYSTTFVGAGDYALAFGPAVAGAGGGGPPVLAISLGVTVLLIAAVIVLVRRRTLRAAGGTDAPDATDGTDATDGGRS